MLEEQILAGLDERANFLELTRLKWTATMAHSQGWKGILKLLIAPSCIRLIQVA